MATADDGGQGGSGEPRVATAVQIDPFLGAEPEVPGLNAPEAPAGEEGEPEAELTADLAEAEEAERTAEPEAEAEAEPPAEGELPPPKAAAPKLTWRELKATRRERDELSKRLEAIEAERAKEQVRLAQYEQHVLAQQQREQEMWRQQQAYEQQQQMAQGTPGVDRPYTQAEVMELRQADPVEYSRLMAETAHQQTVAMQQQMQLQQTQMALQHQIDQFRSREPAYDDAVRFLEEREVARFRAAGVPDQQIPAMVQQRAGLLVTAALQQGRSLPEMAWAVAQAEGWAPRAVGAAAAPTARSPVERVRNAAAVAAVANTSLSGATGGSASRPAITRADLARMSEAELEKLDKELGIGWERNVD